MLFAGIEEIQGKLNDRSSVIGFSAMFAGGAGMYGFGAGRYGVIRYRVLLLAGSVPSFPSCEGGGARTGGREGRGRL